MWGAMPLRVGLQLLATDDSWQPRLDMDPASMRNLVLGQASRDVSQYVILRTGLDSFARSRIEIASRLTIFEVDRPEPQPWKRQRLIVRRVFGPPNRCRRCRQNGRPSYCGDVSIRSERPLRMK